MNISKEVDTFYIYPTAYNDSSDSAPDMCTIDSKAMRTSANNCYETQATAYEAATNVKLDLERGVVVTHTDVLAPMDANLGFGPESYHGGDYTLWYTNIQENVKKRVEAYLKK